MKEKALLLHCPKCSESLVYANKHITKDGYQVTTCQCGHVIKYKIEWVE